MIRAYRNSDDSVLLDCVKKNKEQNVYLYLDACSEGFAAEEIQSFLCVENGRIKALVYVYFHSIQLMRFEPLLKEDIAEIRELILRLNIVRLSGEKMIIHEISKGLDCIVTDGYLMECRNRDQVSFDRVTVATPADIPKIAALIIKDPHMGRGYTFDVLQSQLLYRMQHQNCKNYIIKSGDAIVSHFATYAVGDDLAVLSGMITKSDFRGQGLGSLLVKQLSSDVRNRDHKRPMIYCYEEEYLTWYQKLGYDIIGQCAKLEIMKN